MEKVAFVGLGLFCFFIAGYLLASKFGGFWRFGRYVIASILLVIALFVFLEVLSVRTIHDTTLCIGIQQQEIVASIHRSRFVAVQKRAVTGRPGSKPIFGPPINAD